MRIDAIVLAAGSGERFGGPTPKAFLELGGIPILARAVAGVAAAGVDRLVVVAPPRSVPAAEAAIRDHAPEVTTVVPGGATRVESCRLGLAALDGDDRDIVVVHDAARPLATIELFRRVVAAVAEGADAATATIGSTDTVAILEGDRVTAIPERTTIARVQTPQAFRREVLRRAHAAAAAAGDTTPTDDCGLVLRYAPESTVRAVEGDERNVKITRPADLDAARGLLGG